ncbi:Serine/threonine-protein kinase PrkC [Enhygromyxa salina]|uniref:Serine/threonine-protein kinase PrkC n=1 Tax=Enhygromyxa salina TaxID=215803 RepID=A0A2S9XBM2_9BACT|nr:serine/threonine-protein kinase [Enhygromyxa salina]PRP90200.1 Serine/threonine-protein kinase PrkC [Enhygromyxa salina]
MSRELQESSERRIPSARWLDLIDEVEASPGHEFGRFKLLELLGGAGMGVVFRAYDPKIEREVALKLWKLPRDEAREAVIHEAKCLAKLSHPNVVTIHGTDEVDGDVALIMEFIDGMDGRKWISTQRPTWWQIVDFYVLAGRGLAAAHAAGLEHGDFKPDNVLLGRDKRVRVADFGIARALREHITGEDDPAEDSYEPGTPDYMAPERLLGRRGDERSDQFSFCVSVWECLYGKRPFDAPTEVAILEAMEGGVLQTDPAETAPEIPRRLRQVIARGLAINPGERWPDMDSLLAALKEIRERPEERKRWRWLAASGVGLVVGSSAMTAWLVMTLTDTVSETGIKPVRGTTILEAEDSSDTDGATDEGEKEVAAESLVSQLMPHIERGELDIVSREWNLAVQGAHVQGTSIEGETLELARALHERSLAVEHQKPYQARNTGLRGQAMLAYLSAHPSDGAATEIQGIRDDWDRMVSAETLLVTEFTELSLGQLEQVCACEDALSPADDRCKGRDAAAVHRCLAGLLADHESAVKQYLDCSVPALTEHGECLGAAADCDPERLATCKAERAQAMGACPPLGPTLETALVGCIRGD